MALDTVVADLAAAATALTQTVIADTGDRRAAMDLIDGYGLVAGGVSGHQMQIALLNAGGYQAVVNGLASPPDEAAIRWQTGAPVKPSDPLAVFIQSAAGYNSGQMNALFAAAALIR